MAGVHFDFDSKKDRFQWFSFFRSILKGYLKERYLNIQVGEESYKIKTMDEFYAVAFPGTNVFTVRNWGLRNSPKVSAIEKVRNVWPQIDELIIKEKASLDAARKERDELIRKLRLEIENLKEEKEESRNLIEQLTNLIANKPSKN